jgi:hypothetical protein
MTDPWSSRHFSSMFSPWSILASLVRYLVIA